MREEDGMALIFTRLEQLDSVILLSSAVGTVFIVGSVTGVDLATEDGTLERATGLLDFFRRQFAGDRGTVLPLKGRWEFRVRQKHRLKLHICQTREVLAFVALTVVLMLEMVGDSSALDKGSCMKPRFGVSGRHVRRLVNVDRLGKRAARLERRKFFGIPL